MAKNVAAQVSDGMDVYDADEEKIGTVHEFPNSGARGSQHVGGAAPRARYWSSRRGGGPH